MVSIFGTMAADIPRGLGIDLWVTTGVYLAAVVVIFVLWYRTEGTLSFSAITAGRREWFYWAAVLATFALGTALGDLTADVWGLGNLASGLMFLVLIVLPMIATRWLGLDAVAGFWIAYVLTRPLGCLVRGLDGHARRPRRAGDEHARRRAVVGTRRRRRRRVPRREPRGR